MAFHSARRSPAFSVEPPQRRRGIMSSRSRPTIGSTRARRSINPIVIGSIPCTRIASRLPSRRRSRHRTGAPLIAVAAPPPDEIPSRIDTPHYNRRCAGGPKRRWARRGAVAGRDAHGRVAAGSRWRAHCTTRSPSSRPGVVLLGRPPRHLGRVVVGSVADSMLSGARCPVVGSARIRRAGRPHQDRCRVRRHAPGPRGADRRGGARRCGRRARRGDGGPADSTWSGIAPRPRGQLRRVRNHRPSARQRRGAGAAGSAGATVEAVDEHAVSALVQRSEAWTRSSAGRAATGRSGPSCSAASRAASRTRRSARCWCSRATPSRPSTRARPGASASA